MGVGLGLGESVGLGVGESVGAGEAAGDGDGLGAGAAEGAELGAGGAVEGCLDGVGDAADHQAGRPPCACAGHNAWPMEPGDGTVPRSFGEIGW